MFQSASKSSRGAEGRLDARRARPRRFKQDLGWCVDGVNTNQAFAGTKCAKNDARQHTRSSKLCEAAVRRRGLHEE